MQTRSLITQNVVTLAVVALLAACSSTDETIAGTAIISTAAEAAGENCEFGGTAVSYGVDLNENGSLDAGEVSDTRYVCAPAEGSGDPSGDVLVSTTPEAAGANCEFGGVAVGSGVDLNGDGALGADEVTTTEYVCADAPVEIPAVLTVSSPEDPGANCEFGGFAVAVGADTDGDGTLDADEITETSYACETLDDQPFTYIVDPVDEPAGENCEFGGVAFRTGADLDRSTTLDDAEVGAVEYVCSAGPTETPATLVGTGPEPAGANCQYGGLVIRSGADVNGDTMLGDDEVAVTQYVCNDEPTPLPATLARLSDEAAGDNCAFGGQRLQVGGDADASGVLDDAEVATTSYICYPSSEIPELLETAQWVGLQSESCPGGFVSRQYGLDLDGDGTLGEVEAVTGSFSCNLPPQPAATGRLDVDSCTVGARLDLAGSDPDGAIVGYEVDLLAPIESVELTISRDGVVSVPPGEYAGGFAFEVTATDDFGVATRQTYFAYFTGEGCTPLDAFYGVIPSTCREIEVEVPAGDDRGGMYVTTSYAYYNGDDALVRADLAFDNLEIIYSGNVDTLLVDEDTRELYSLWSSDFTFTSVLDSAGWLSGTAMDADVGYNQLALLDESTLQVTGLTTLSEPIPTLGTYLPWSGGETSSFYQLESILLGKRSNLLVVLLRGYDFDTGATVVELRAYDIGTGEGLAQIVLDNLSATLNAVAWYGQEVEIQQAPIWRRDGRDTILVRSYNGVDDAWNEIDVYTGEFVVRTTSYARDCDQYNLALSADGTRAYTHSESSCWTGPGEELIAVCDVLPFPNDAFVVDDTGVSAPSGGR